MATTVVKDISYLWTDFEGMVPSLPRNLSDGQTMRWAEGLRWESEYFNLGEGAAKLRPEDLDEDVRKMRKKCLFKLHMATRDNPAPLFHQTVVTVDRLLLTRQCPSNMLGVVAACHLKQLLNYRGSEEVAEVARSLTRSLDLLEMSATDLLAWVAWVEEALGEFSNVDVHTPFDWYKRMVPAQAYTDSAIDRVFLFVELIGSLSHHAPSSVAATVMVRFMGRQAEPFMHGYNLPELAVIRAEVDRILDPDTEL